VLLSLIGLLFDRNKTAAWLGLAAGMILLVLFLVVGLCS
jgi:hypothetical protein